MRKFVLYFAVMCIALFVLTGCNMVTNMLQPSEEKKETEPVPEDSEESEESVEEEEADAQEAQQEEADAEVDDETDTEEAADSKENDNMPKQGDYNIYLGGEVTEEEDKIVIEGESNLIPGTRVEGEVTVGEEEEPDFLADTTEKVSDDGTFLMELEHPGKDVDEVRVAVNFHFDTEQSDEVIRHYGDRGQKLEGPYIYKHQKEVGGRKQVDIYNKAMAEIEFEPEDTLSVRHFKEPDWYDIPDDMGDPRVWIEVDEINDDQEYFYLHGRSNLVEGTELKATYGNNRDKTLVLPDGSFDFKVDYEYLEDTPFVVQFIPEEFQWNLVEEKYGKKGQKLVGDLVETNQFNTDKQYVEKEIQSESQEIEVPDNVELKVDGSEITMLVPDDVLFDFDKHALKDSSKKLLKEISKSLDSSFNKEDLEIVISGHTDNVGDKKYNLELSEKRANEVKKYLEKQLKSQETSFTTEGLGDRKPIASNKTEKGQAKNRRVEIVINLKR